MGCTRLEDDDDGNIFVGELNKSFDNKDSLCKFFREKPGWDALWSDDVDGNVFVDESSRHLWQRLSMYIFLGGRRNADEKMHDLDNTDKEPWTFQTERKHLQ